MKMLIAGTVLALLLTATAGSAQTGPSFSDLISNSLSQAITADDSLFTSTDPNPSSRTISVSFFAGHIGVTPSGSAFWTNTTSNDSDPYSVEIDIPAGGNPTNSFSSFAGINFHHIPTAAPLSPPAFDFMANKTAASGGSPRLVMIFSDGGNINLRPLTWTQDMWTSEGTGNPTPDPAFETNWDNNGGTCGFLYQQMYKVVVACHLGATVTAAFIVSDSGWLSAPYVNWIDNIQYNGQTISQPPDNANQ